jgi:hypothetical protein
MEKIWKFLEGDHPYRVMSDFAVQLEKDTGGLISGFVDMRNGDNSLNTLKLCMTSSYLNGYTQPLFKVQSKSNMHTYPVSLNSLIFDSPTIECDNIDELTTELLKMISSKQTMIALGNVKMIIERKKKMSELTE